MSAVVACWHPKAEARAALRRALPRRRGRARLRMCRSPEAVQRVLEAMPVDAMVFEPRSAPGVLLPVAKAYSSVPAYAYLSLRSDDGPALVSWKRGGLAGVLVAGVDDAVLDRLITAGTASARRRRALGAAPRLLRLAEPLQLAVWEEVLSRATRPMKTAEIAASLHVTREHLSREFGAGGAPNLKRVIDLVRVVCAADLLASPGYTVSTVARLLGFGSSAHLTGAAQRVTGGNAQGLRALGVRGVLERFLAGRTRSRL